MQNVTLRQLEAFLGVAEELHFGRAAERLSVSAPWLSHTVSDLERALRVELLTRTTRSVQLTPAGRVFAGPGQPGPGRAVIGDQDRARPDRFARQLKLGYTIGAGLEVVPRLLRTYHEREPTADCRDRGVRLHRSLRRAAGQPVHAAVVRPPLGLAGLVSVELATERLVACLPDDHPLAARYSLGVADVLPEPIVAAPVSPGPWRDYWILTDYRSGPGARWWPRPAPWTPRCTWSPAASASASPPRPSACGTAGPASPSCRSWTCRRARSCSPGGRRTPA